MMIVGRRISRPLLVARRGGLVHSRTFATFFDDADELIEQELQEAITTFEKRHPGDAGRVIAHALAHCRTFDPAKPLKNPPEGVGSTLSEEDGYHLQHLTASIYGSPDVGGAPVGYKIGATNEATQKRIGLGGPFLAQIFSKSTFVQVNDERRKSSPQATHNLPVVNTRGVEAEWAFILSKDLPIRSEVYIREEIAEAIAYVAPCIEVTGNRFVNPPPKALFLADGGGCGFVALGPRDLWVDKTARECTHADQLEVKTYINNQLVAEGSGKQVLGHPLDALTWLANQKERATLHAGNVISSGASNGLVPIPALGKETTIKVDFVGWGGVELTLFGKSNQPFLPYDVFMSS